MATIFQTTESSMAIRVALIIEAGHIKPVWFEQTDKRARDRIFIKEVSSVWSHYQGCDKIVNFAVSGAGSSYRLSLNTAEFTWELGVVEESAFPSPTSNRGYYRDSE